MPVHTTSRRQRLRVLLVILTTASCVPSPSLQNDAGHVAFLDRLSTPESMRTRYGILNLECYAWTDRMPSASSSSARNGGHPLYVALRLSLDPARARGDSLLLSALSFWLPKGDSVIATVALTTLEGHPAWLGIDTGPNIEFTNDRTIRAYPSWGGADSLAPHLLVIGPNMREVIRLPALLVESVY